MRIIGMDKTTGNKTIVLILLRNGRRPKDQIVYYFRTIKSGNGNQAGKQNDTIVSVNIEFFFKDRR